MMKIRRILIPLTLLLVLLLTACNGKEPFSRESKMKDVSLEDLNYKKEYKENKEKENLLKAGLYQLEEKDYDDEGWKAVMSITVKNDEIIASSYEEVDSKGHVKTTYIDYPGNNTGDADTRPMTIIPKLNQALIETQDPDSIPIIEGADSTTKSFKTYAKILMNAAVDGNHSIFIIEN